jgi:hypothetical protein
LCGKSGQQQKRQELRTADNQVGKISRHEPISFTGNGAGRLEVLGLLCVDWGVRNTNGSFAIALRKQFSPQRTQRNCIL